MSKYPTIYLLFLILLSASQSFAQSRAFDCLNQAGSAGKSGREVLAKVQSAYASINSLRASFQQDSFLAALEVSELASGEVFFSKPGRMRWQYKEPDVQAFLMKDDTIWFYQEAERQVLIEKPDKVLISELPGAFLMGLGNLERDFTVLRSCRGPEGLVLELSAKNLGDDLRSLSLLCHPETFMPKGARISDLGGNITAILFVNPQYGAELPESTFDTDFGSGLDIIDRRQKSPERVEDMQ